MRLPDVSAAAPEYLVPFAGEPAMQVDEVFLEPSRVRWPGRGTGSDGCGMRGCRIAGSRPSSRGLVTGRYTAAAALPAVGRERRGRAGRLCPAGDGQPGVGGAVAGGKVDGHRDRGRAAGDRRWRRLRDARPARGLSSPAEAGRVTAGHSRGAAAPKAQPAGSDEPHRARARRARSGPAWPRRRGLRCPAASAASPHRPRFPPRGPARRPFHS